MAVFIAIVFVFVMLVGPIMMLKPTKTQRKQAKLRTLASQRGLMVGGGITLSNGRFVPQYTQALAKDRDEAISFELRKQSFSHEGHFSGIWDWVGEEPGLNDALLAPLKQLVDDVDSDFFSFGRSNIGVFVMWNEALRGKTEEAAVEHIVQFLKALSCASPVLSDQVLS